MQNEDKLPAADPVLQPALHSFPRSHRLSGKLLFSAVYDAKVKSTRGPLVMYSLPNGLAHLRMGISISRRVGTAPKRNRIKRLLREAFRLNPIKLDRGYDLVVVVRPHVPMVLVEYEQSLLKLIQKSDAEWKLRQPYTS
jgi:ribonuclease P protein component